MKLNNLLFKTAQIEEKLETLINSDNELERLIGHSQLRTLNVFKFYPIRSYEESRIVLEKLNKVFKTLD